MQSWCGLHRQNAGDMSHVLHDPTFLWFTLITSESSPRAVRARLAKATRFCSRLIRGVRRHGETYMTATVVGIYTTPTSGSTLQSVRQATLEAGKGLVGDRYYAGVGTFSKKVMPPDAEITLIESEEIDRFNSNERAAHPPGAFRRNLVTSGIRLNDLVGKRFWVGSALLEGKRLCEPCGHLAKLVVPTVVEGMLHRAGLRATTLKVTSSILFAEGVPWRHAMRR